MLPIIGQSFSAKLEKQIHFKSNIFHALSDPTRLEIIAYLRDGEKCVCQIVPHLNLIQPLVSRHLKTLKDAGIVRCRKDGTKRVHTIVDPKIHRVVDALTPELVNSLTNEVMEQMTCQKEMNILDTKEKHAKKESSLGQWKKPGFMDRHAPNY